jgi:hypothetical protein
MEKKNNSMWSIYLPINQLRPVWLSRDKIFALGFWVWLTFVAEESVSQREDKVASTVVTIIITIVTYHCLAPQSVITY